MPKISESDLILNKDGSIFHLSLKPENIADTIIAVGDPSRVYNVSEHFDRIDFEMNKREFITHTGRYKGKRLTVMSTGMGTDNIEIFLTELDALVNIDLKKRELKPRKKRLKIIRVGTSGALQEDIALGSSLVSESAIGLDALMCYYNLPQSVESKKLAKKINEFVKLPLRPYIVKCSEKLIDTIGKGMIRGNTVTCPGFYAPQGRKIRIDLKYPTLLEDLNYFHDDGFWLTNFEMETAAYYALGKILGHDVLSVNAIIANRITNKVSKRPEKIIDDLIKVVLDRL